MGPPKLFQLILTSVSTKTFFVGWKENANSSDSIANRTYLELICTCDGLVLYLTLLKMQFPGAEIVTWYLGSDPNEQLFAFIKVSYSSGRSRNMDSIMHSGDPL